MKKTVAQWIAYALGLFAAGPLVALVLSRIAPAGGAPRATLLVSDSLAGGIAGGVVALAIAGVLGVVASRFASRAAGLTTAGLALAWAPFASARLDDVMRVSGSGAGLRPLALEGLLLAGLSLLIARVILGPVRGSGDTGDEPVDATSWGIAGLITIVVGGVGALVVARSTLPGQTLAAAFVGALLGTLVGRVVMSSVPGIVFAGAALLLACLGPLAGSLLVGPQPLADLYAGQIPAIARITPLAWIPGALLGVPVGLAWAESMIDRHADTQPA